MNKRALLATGLASLFPLLALSVDKSTDLTFDNPEETFIECTAVRASGKNGKGMSFSGSTYAMLASPVIQGTKVLKLEFDLLPKADSGVILACFQEDGNKRSFLISLDKGTLLFCVNADGTPDAVARVQLPIELNQWHHVKAEYQPGAMMLQMDGTIIRGDAPMTLFTSDIPLQLGRYFAGYGMRHFTGTLDNLRIFASDKEPALTFTRSLADVPHETILADWDFSRMKALPESLDPSLGTWTVSDGALNQTARLKDPRALLIRTTGADYQDVAAEAVIKLLPGKYRRGGLGLRLNCTGPGFFPESGYFFEVEDSNGTRFARIFSWKRSQRRHLPDFTAGGDLYLGEPEELTLLAESRMPATPASELTMTFAAAGARLVGYVDGKKCVAAIRGDCAKGEAGLLAYGSAVAVQRWRIRNILDSEILDLSGIELKTVDSQNKVNPPMLSWNELIYGTAEEKADIRFELEIAEDKDFRKVLHRAEDLAATVCRPAVGFPRGTYFWRVRKTSPRGTFAWSLPGTFAVASPAVSPALAGTLTPRQFMEEQPVWTVPCTGDPAGTMFMLDGKADALTVTCDGARWTLRPTAPVAPGLHVIVRQNAVETQEIPIVRTDRELPRLSLRRDGILLKDGKPFFPVGTYRDPSDTDTDFTGTLEAGFNFTHSYYFEETDRGEAVLRQDRAYLDRAGKLGVNVFLACSRKEVFKYGNSLEPAAARILREMAARRLTAPNYISCDPHEEPDGGPWGLSPRAVHRVHRLLKDVDPVHLTHTLLYLPKSFKDYSRSVDVLMIDPYPQPYDNVDFVYRLLRQAAEDSGKPIWAAIQAFDWRIADYTFDYKVPAKEHRPSVAELRCMAYLSLAAGAKGMVFYWWREDKAKIREQYPAIWAEICRLTREIKALTPFLVSEEPAPECFASTEGIRAKAFVCDGKIKLLVINTLEKSVKTSVALGGTAARVLSLELSPLEARVLEL